MRPPNPVAEGSSNLPHSSSRPRLGRVVVWGAAVALGSAAAVLCVVVFTRAGWQHRDRAERSPAIAAPAPPMIDATGLDPAVARVVKEAQEAVRQDPASAGAWGKLGMVLAAHGLATGVSGLCFAEAERLDRNDPRWPYLRAVLLQEGNPEA